MVLVMGAVSVCGEEKVDVGAAVAVVVSVWVGIVCEAVGGDGTVGVLDGILIVCVLVS